jgi:hypothetical protein
MKPIVDTKCIAIRSTKLNTANSCPFIEINHKNISAINLFGPHSPVVKGCRYLSFTVSHTGHIPCPAPMAYTPRGLLKHCSKQRDESSPSPLAQAYTTHKHTIACSHRILILLTSTVSASPAVTLSTSANVAATERGLV